MPARVNIVCKKLSMNLSIKKTTKTIIIIENSILIEEKSNDFE